MLIINIIIHFTIIVLNVLQISMFFRAILSWINLDEDNKIQKLLEIITEPILIPIRKLLSKFQVFEQMPIDLSFIFGFILLLIVRMILESFII